MQRIPTNEEEDNFADFPLDSPPSGESFDSFSDHAIVEHYHDEESDDSHSEDYDDNHNHDDDDEVALQEMGHVARKQRRRLESMGIMLGDHFVDGRDAGDHCCGGRSQYWYVWLCCTLVAVMVTVVAAGGALQYRQQSALLHGTGENGDDYDASQCRVYDQKTLQIVENHLAQANDTATFCQADVSLV